MMTLTAGSDGTNHLQSITEPATREVILISSSNDGSDSSDSQSSDDADPVSRKARQLAVRAAARRATIQDFYRSISRSEYLSNVEEATEIDPLDLRLVHSRSTAVATADACEESESMSEDSSSSAASAPKKRRHGYEIDGFVVNSSSSEDDDE
jgi:hypothetical protein